MLARVEKSEDSFDELVLSFYSLGLWDGTQAVRLGGRCRYLLSHLGGPEDSS